MYIEDVTTSIVTAIIIVILIATGVYVIGIKKWIEGDYYDAWEVIVFIAAAIALYAIDVGIVLQAMGV